MRPLTRAEIREVDARAIGVYALPGIVLMENAGRGAAAILDALAGGPCRVAVDLPSGLDCDTGAAPGDCVRADATATFVAPKVGFAAPGAAAFTGAVHVVGIGVPRRLLLELDPRAAPDGPRAGAG